MSKSDLPLSKALLWIVASTLLFSGTFWIGYAVYRVYFNTRAHDHHYDLAAIVQTNLKRDMLKTAFLAELLDLSADRPKNLYRLDLKEARQNLRAFALIKKATLKRIPPGTLYIDYEMRTPIAYLRDCSNTAIDEEGYLFPFKPFFSPKKLPEIYVGQWDGTGRLTCPKWHLAQKVLREATLRGLDPIALDVSRAHAESFGQRQILLTLQALESTYLLRLTPHNFEKGLQQFALVDLTQWQGNVVVDLRVPDLAFVNVNEPRPCPNIKRRNRARARARSRSRINCINFLRRAYGRLH